MKYVPILLLFAKSTYWSIRQKANFLMAGKGITLLSIGLIHSYTVTYREKFLPKADAKKILPNFLAYLEIWFGKRNGKY